MKDPISGMTTVGLEVVGEVVEEVGLGATGEVHLAVASEEVIAEEAGLAVIEEEAVVLEVIADPVASAIEEVVAEMLSATEAARAAANPVPSAGTGVEVVGLEEAGNQAASAAGPEATEAALGADEGDNPFRGDER